MLKHGAPAGGLPCSHVMLRAPCRQQVWLWPVWKVLQWEFPWAITGLAVTCLLQHASSPASPSLHPTQLFLLRLNGAPARPPVPGEATDPIAGASIQASSSKTVFRPCLGKSTLLLAAYPRLWGFPSTILLFKPICQFRQAPAVWIWEHKAIEEFAWHYSIFSLKMMVVVIPEGCLTRHYWS